MKKIKVRFLKHHFINGRTYEEGQEDTFDEELANNLCAKRSFNNGHGIVHFSIAISLENLEKIHDNLEASDLTLEERRSLGIKNVVPDAFEGKPLAYENLPEVSEEEKKIQGLPAPERKAQKNSKGK